MNLLRPVVAVLVLGSAVGVSAQKTPKAAEPFVWGALSHNSGCVIFAEGHKTTGRFYVVAVTTKTVGKLTVVETQNYTFNEKQVLETDETMNQLMTIAQKDHIKFVKIPEKYSPDLLDKARSSCKPDAQ